MWMILYSYSNILYLYEKMVSYSADGTQLKLIWIPSGVTCRRPFFISVGLAKFGYMMPVFCPQEAKLASIWKGWLEAISPDTWPRWMNKFKKIKCEEFPGMTLGPHLVSPAATSPLNSPRSSRGLGWDHVLPTFPQCHEIDRRILSPGIQIVWNVPSFYFH